jgi:NADH dehydrogenase/NADH:ubiquinone oxidoreductase subunit G
LRKAERNYLNVDHEYKFLTNTSHDLEKQLSTSNLCFLIGVNTRYENPNLNIQLRSRYKKGNFKILSLGSLIDLTFPISHVGLNSKSLTSILSGNNKVCQELLNYSNPTIIISSEIYKRKDSQEISNLLSLLKHRLNKFSNVSFHVLNSALNEAGLNYVQKFKSLTENDLIQNFGVYFINVPKNKTNIQKIINIKLLKYIKLESKNPKTILEQNSGFIDTHKNFYKAYNYINLPNSTFFESSGTYLTTNGLFKTNIQVIKTTQQTKDDWQIFRKFFFYINKIQFLSNYKYNNLIHFNCNSKNKYKNFINFLYYPTTSLTKFNFKIPCNKINYNLFLKNSLKIKKNKIYNTQFKQRVLDFYIGGGDLYSSYSLTMIKCSKLHRLTATNFTYLL